MSDSIHILNGDEEIAKFLKVSIPHIRRHGDGIPVIRKIGNIRISSEEAFQAWLISELKAETADAADENMRARPVSDWHDKGAIAAAGKRKRLNSKQPT
ncbi:MAG TPA: hypothetical protein VMV35_04360 [Halothiobacillus sp.]|nr:hypothetical protein [Halothiobacillus sp.]